LVKVKPILKPSQTKIANSYISCSKNIKDTPGKLNGSTNIFQSLLSLIDKMSKFLNLAKNTSNSMNKSIDELNTYSNKTLLTLDLEKMKIEAQGLLELTKNVDAPTNYENSDLKEIIATSDRRMSLYKKLFEVCNVTFREIFELLGKGKTNTSNIVNININVTKKCIISRHKGKQSIISANYDTGEDYTKSIHIPSSLIKQVGKPRESKMEYKQIDYDPDKTIPISYQIYPKTRSKSLFNSHKGLHSPKDSEESFHIIDDLSVSDYIILGIHK
jgi:hypothetical protein